MKRALIVIFSFFAGGCAPIPHNEYLAHQVTGTILDNGIAASGVKVKLVVRTGETVTAVSDQYGRFQIGPITKFRMLLSIGDAFYQPRLTLQVGNRELDGGQMWELGKTQVFCDITYPRGADSEYCKPLNDGP